MEQWYVVYFKNKISGYMVRMSPYREQSVAEKKAEELKNMGYEEVRIEPEEAIE